MRVTPLWRLKQQSGWEDPNRVKVLKRAEIELNWTEEELTHSPPHARCISDCKHEDDAAVESCKLMYEEPDDADDLPQCIQNAKHEYQSCIDECTS